MPAKAENYRPDFSSERAPHINKSITFYKYDVSKERWRKIGRGSQMRA
jgi:hypothetical protein